MAIVIVNNQPVDIGNERLNLIQAALRGGVFIPHYCWHPALTVVASCRMCLVEVGEKKPDGTVAMQPKVVPACQTPAKDGTVIVTTRRAPAPPRPVPSKASSSTTRSTAPSATRPASASCRTTPTATATPRRA